jgi:tetratricopeptide (TPR) repeat protein
VITASQDRTARVWDPRAGKPLLPPLKHGGPVTLAVFSPDGLWAATAAGSVVRIWNAATGEAVGPVLKHAPGKAVTYVSFTADGELVTSTGDPANPAARRNWNFRPESRPVPDLIALAQLLGGRRLDDSGAEVPPEANDLRAAWGDFQKRFPRDLAATPEQVLSWHRRGAEECERQRLWAGAVLHLRQLLDNEPGRSDLLVRRARARGELGQWDQALADYRRAVELKPGDIELIGQLARVHGELGQWEQAADAYSQAIKAKENDRNLWVQRARARAELGRWNESAADFARAIDLGLSDVHVWRQHALVRLATGDVESYRKMCLRLVRRFGDSPDAAVVRVVALTCALSPDAVPDLKPLVQQTEGAVAAHPKSGPDHLALGALLYRAGQFEPAVEHIRTALRLSDPDRSPVGLLFLAMAQQRLGQVKEAGQSLQEAAQAIIPKGVEKGPLTWDRRLEMELLRREAEK